MVFFRSSFGRLSVVGRWNQVRYKRTKRDGNLNKSTFLSFGVLWFILGSSLVRPWSLARSIYIRYKGREGNLNIRIVQRTAQAPTVQRLEAGKYPNSIRDNKQRKREEIKKKTERESARFSGVFQLVQPYQQLQQNQMLGNQSCGPAATRALPASLVVYLAKFLMKRPAKSLAFSSH